MSRQVNTTTSGVSFAEKLNIELAGTTSESFARQISRTLRTVQRWRSGDTEPSGSDLVLIARALGVTVEALWPDEPESPEQRLHRELHDGTRGTLGPDGETPREPDLGDVAA